MTDCSIEIASQAALPACLALLGPVSSPDCVVLSARDRDGTLAGAAGALWQSWGDPPGFPLWVQVLPDRRRRGIGSQLLIALRRHAKGETSGLWSAQPLPEDSPAARFARSNGFISVQRQFVFDADPAHFLIEIERLVNLLEKRGRVPEMARIVSLEHELVAPVAALLLRELTTVRRDIERVIAVSLDADPATAPVDVDRSPVLLVDGQVAGVLLSRRQSDGLNSLVLCNAVAPAFRRGWANAVLLESAMRSGVKDGCTNAVFDCAETNRDTLGIAKRSKARLVRTEALFRYALTSAS